jgi:molybdopterin biosynthesis enzyme
MAQTPSSPSKTPISITAKQGLRAQDHLIRQNMKAGENVRPRGMDIHAGEIVLQKGRVLKPQDLGLLATLGMADVECPQKTARCTALLRR